MNILKIALFATAAAIISLPAQAQECSDKPVSVGFIPKLDTDPYFKVAEDGAKEAQKEIGGEFMQLAPSQVTAEAQIEFINAMVAQQVNVIAIAGNDQRAVTPALKRAVAQGVKVITYDSDVTADSRTVFANQAKGDSLAEMMLKSAFDLMGGEGEFAILSGTPNSTNQNAWVQYMKDKLGSDPAFSKMKLVQVAYGEESEQVNQQQALALVQAFPDLKAIIVPAGIGLPAAARALEEAGLLGKVKLTGLAPATLVAKYIKAGQMQDIWWNVQDLGYLTYYAAQAVGQCKLTGKEGEKFAAGRLGEYTVGKDGEIVLGPAKIVTPDNLAEFKF